MKQEIVYLKGYQALELVDRIAERTERFNHTMVDDEKNSMANLLGDIGVSVDDIIDVSRLADNYAINAEIVTPDEADNYSHSALRDALFSWEHEGETYYCLSW
jgi:hypothetical protein